MLMPVVLITPLIGQIELDEYLLIVPWLSPNIEIALGIARKRLVIELLQTVDNL